jgi:hypothetical protein
MRRLLRDNGLSIAMFGLFFVFISAQSVMGLLDYNSTQREHGQRPVSYVQYLGSGDFVEAVFENWESEFLQMGLYYRFTFNAQSVVSLLWAARRFSQLPDRELYYVRPPWSWLFRANQVASLGVLLSGVRVMGILRFAGLKSVRDLLTGNDVRPAPEAQGPPTTRW